MNAVEAAASRWDTIQQGKFSHIDLLPSMYSIGARNKRDYDYEEFEVAASRVVHMPEFHVELVTGAWIDPITEFFKNKCSGPVYIGNSIVKFERFAKALEDSTVCLKGDWKRFDSTLYITIILCALAILRCFYDLEDAEIDRQFLAIFDSVSIKDYYLPGGRVFRCSHGLPSGVKCTNLLGTIINLLALDYCVDDFNFVAGGDDFVIVAKSKLETDIDSFINHFSQRSEKLGMKLKILELKFSNSTNIHELPSFYKYVVKYGIPMIPVAAMLERVFMPWNKMYTDPNHILKFLQDLMPSLGAPATHLVPFYLFLLRMLNKTLNGKWNFQYVVGMHTAVYSKMMKKRKLPARKDFEEVEFSSAYYDIFRIEESAKFIKFSKNFISFLRGD